MRDAFKSEYLILLSLAFMFMLSFEALGERKKRKYRKWSATFTNAYTFYQLKKGSTAKSYERGIGVDGQMNTFFSNLELRRNFGRYELGGKIQLFKETFVSPFLKINMAKNRRNSDVIPYLTIGVVPASLTGVYTRLGIDLMGNRYFAISPFVGAFAWYKIKDLDNDEIFYQKQNVHFHGGLSTTIYF